MTTKKNAERVVRQSLVSKGWPEPFEIRLSPDGPRGQWAFDAFNLVEAEPWCVSGYVHTGGGFEGPYDDPEALQRYIE